jgi:hypothetical protein
MSDAAYSPRIPHQHRQPPERLEAGPVTFLELGQLVAETSRPVPRAALSTRAAAGLWALRIFVVLVSLMVIYTFVVQLH